MGGIVSILPSFRSPSNTHRYIVILSVTFYSLKLPPAHFLSSSSFHGLYIPFFSLHCSIYKPIICTCDIKHHTDTQIICDHAWFYRTIVVSIVAAGIIVGLQSYPQLDSEALKIASILIQVHPLSLSPYRLYTCCCCFFNRSQCLSHLKTWHPLHWNII